MSQPYLVLDQNIMRCKETISNALNRCCREKLRLLIPDIAGMEFSKSANPIQNWRRNLQLIAPFAEFVAVGRKTTQIQREEITTGLPCAQIADEIATGIFQTCIRRHSAGDDTALNELVFGSAWNSMQATLNDWSDHDANKRIIIQFTNLLRPVLSDDILVDLRKCQGDAMGRWLASTDGISYVFQGIQNLGARDNTAAVRLVARPSAIAAYISGMAAVSLYWIAFGGLESANPERLTNDIIDVQYAIPGALSISLETEDKRLSTIHRAIREGNNGRARWFANAIEGLNSNL